MKYMLGIILGIALIVPICRAEDQSSLKDQKAKDSYSLGYEFGANLKRQGVEIDEDILLSAIQEGLEGRKPLLGHKEIRDTLIQLRKREGSGLSPKETDSVSVHYRGILVDGTEFDSSVRGGKPATFSVKGMIKAWTEALQLMKVGSKWQIFVPADLAYGQRRFGRIQPNSSLIFEIELLSIVDGADPQEMEPKKGGAQSQGQ